MTARPGPDQGGGATMPPDGTVAERRADSEVKALGMARFVADRVPAGALWVEFLGSPSPRGRIVSLDVAPARSVAGVRAVITGADIGLRRFGRSVRDYPVLAVDEVQFAGQRMAAVAAEDRATAREGVARIVARIDERAPLLDPLEALDPAAEVLHPDYGSYEGAVASPLGLPNVQGYHVWSLGDAAAGLAECDRVFEHSFRFGPNHHGAIEPRACVVRTDGEAVHVLSTCKEPFRLRDQLAQVARISAHRITVEPAPIGGDFGGKGLPIAEYACYFLALRTGRPVCAVSTYEQELVSTTLRHAGSAVLTTGLKDGRLWAHRARCVFDGGAFAAGKPKPDAALGGAYATMGPYALEHAEVECVTVYTNNPPGGHVRSPGQVQAAFAGESHIDMICAALGVDPVDFRLRHALRAGDREPKGGVAASDASEGVARALVAIARGDRAALTDGYVEAWRSPGARPSRPGRTGPPASVATGRGVAMAYRHEAGVGRATVTCSLLDDGTVEVLVAVPEQGAGSHTMAARVAARALGLPESRVRVRQGDTAQVGWDRGTGGSRVTHLTGQATRMAAAELRERIEAARSRVGRRAGGDADDPGTPGPGERDLEAVASTVADAAGHRRLTACATYESEHVPSMYAGLAVRVEVDRRTGAIAVAEADLVLDVGAVINPTAHRGQIEGGFAFGLGQARYERMGVVDGVVDVGSLRQYRLPGWAEMAPLRTYFLREGPGSGPYGAKAVGESVNALVAPAIANALHDAVGVRAHELPLVPEAVWSLLETGGASW